jgi:hypothetical protein
MDCPICTALNRDDTHESEIQAKAILWQRTGLRIAAENDKSNEAVLESRKRQMRIHFRLDSHRTKDHAA